MLGGASSFPSPSVLFLCLPTVLWLPWLSVLLANFSHFDDYNNVICHCLLELSPISPDTVQISHL